MRANIARSIRGMRITYFMLRKANAKPQTLEFLNGDPVQFVNSDSVELF